MCCHSPIVPGQSHQAAHGVYLLGLLSLALTGCGQQDQRPVILPPVVVPAHIQQVVQPSEPSPAVAAEPPPALEPLLANQLQQAFHERRQQIFNQLHPIGTANRVEVHDVEIDWKRGLATNREEDVKSMTVRFTVFWEGPFEKDGYTKLSWVYDAELGRYVGGGILTTNGITNEDAFYAAGVAIGAAARLALEE